MEFEQEAARLHLLRAGAMVAKSNLIKTVASAVFFFVICSGSILAGTGLRWVGPDNQLLPFETAEEAEEFLKKARVVSRKRVGAGINNPIKVLLEQDGIQAHAVFRDVRVSKPTARFPGKFVPNFRGDALFEISAYRLGKLLGLNNIPPAILRRIDGRKGSLQLWIEKATTEKKRIERDLKPENILLWRLQVQTMRLFDNLIYNEDRNQGNILFDPAWRLWMIDHTRAFRRQKSLLSPNTIWRIEKNLWDRLQQLDLDAVKKAVSPFVSPAEVRAILKRRDLIVQIIDNLIARRGEQLVVFQMPLIPHVVATTEVAATL